MIFVSQPTDKPASVNPPTPAPSSATPTIAKTTKFPGGNIQKNVTTTTSKSIWDFNPTPNFGTTTPTDPITQAPTGNIWSDGLMGITVGILCGVFLMFLLTCLAILWFVRRYRVE